jgi:uncharacterized protein (TIGR03083 family)
VAARSPLPAPTVEEVRRATVEGRRALAATLADLSPQQWDAPSLCAGWRVREVVAHLSMPFRYSGGQIAVGMLRARGSWDRLADRAARADAAAMSTAELVAAVRDNAEHPWKPPGGGYLGALTHDTVHGLDVTAALGLPPAVPPERLEPVLGALTTPRTLRHFGIALDGVELRADDLDWSLGSGTPVSGAAADLALVLSGRRLPAGRLAGRDADRFTGQPV